MSGDWRVDVLIALIGAVGLIVPGRLAYKGAKVGKDPKPEIENHGTVAWEAAQNRKLVATEASRVRDFVSHEHDETRRQMREAIRDMAAQHEETRRQMREAIRDMAAQHEETRACIRDAHNPVPWEMAATLAKVKEVDK